MLTKIDHLGIAVKSLEAALPFYQKVLGLEYTGEETVADQKVRVAFLKLGESKIELLEATDPGSPIALFIESRGEGIHHVAYRVDNLEEKLRELKNGGIKLIDEKPRAGAGGARIAFLHPRAALGSLIELCER